MPCCRLNVPGVGAVQRGVPLPVVVANHCGLPAAPAEPAKWPRCLTGPCCTQNWPTDPVGILGGWQLKVPVSPTPAQSLATPTEQGKPVCICVLPLICHPPATLPSRV